jgi:hypothetical protein
MTITHLLYPFATVVSVMATILAVATIAPLDLPADALGLQVDFVCFSTPIEASPSPCGCPQGQDEWFDICEAVEPNDGEWWVPHYYCTDEEGSTCVPTYPDCGVVRKCDNLSCYAGLPDPIPSSWGCGPTKKGPCGYGYAACLYDQ